MVGMHAFLILLILPANVERVSTLVTIVLVLFYCYAKLSRILTGSANRTSTAKDRTGAHNAGGHSPSSSNSTAPWVSTTLLLARSHTCSESVSTSSCERCTSPR